MLTGSSSFGIIGIATSKASVAAFLLRLSIVTWHKCVLYIVLVTVSVGCFIVALFDYIRCDPIESIWDPLIPAKCWMSASEYTNLSIAVGGEYRLDLHDLGCSNEMQLSHLQLISFLQYCLGLYSGTWA